MDKLGAEVWKLSPVVQRFLGYRAAIPLAQEQIGVMLAVLGSRPHPVGRFLDLGCGDGILAAAMLGQYPASRGVLADFSEPMLAQAHERLGEFASQLKFIDLDYGDRAWVQAVRADGPFDAIVSGYSIHHQPDARKRPLYAEIFDLLGPGGWFVNIEHVAASAPLSTDLFDKHIIDARYAIEQRTGGLRTREQIEDEFQHRPDKQANILMPAEAQCTWLRELGFEEVDCFFRIYELAVFGGRRPAH